MAPFCAGDFSESSSLINKRRETRKESSFLISWLMHYFLSLFAFEDIKPVSVAAILGPRGDNPLIKSQHDEKADQRNRKSLPP